MYCKQCGKPTNNNQDLCDECLAKQNANNPQDQPVVTTAQETNSTSNEQNNGKAIAQLLISLFSCGTLAVVSAIWGLVEGIMILTGSINTDANGNPLSN